MKQKVKNKIMVSLFLALAVSIPLVSVSLMFASAQTDPTYIIPLDDWILNDDIAAIKLVTQLLEENVTVMWAQESFTVGGATYPAGTMYIETPFTTRHGVSSDVMMQWFMWQAKMNRVWHIDVTTANVTANATSLVLPRVVIFYDKSTYDNCVNHYYRLRSLGFKATLAPAMSMVGLWWNDSAHPLSDANVFLIPGGALHLWQFPWGQPRTEAIGNITEFVNYGGGYIGTCAGASEALNKTPYDHLGLVDADYHREWFDGSIAPAGMGANEWKALIGPIGINITRPDHPVMFGYGATAARPGYGPEVPLYYYGGPAFVNMSAGIEVLGTYSSPISQDTDAMGVTNSIWDEPAIVTATYGAGRAVLFGPHPEWPGPGTRMWAQALFFIAQNRIDTSNLDPATTAYNPAEILSPRVNTILSTSATMAPILESFTRIATEIVNFRGGDHYNPIGWWFDEVHVFYGMHLSKHLNDLERDAVKFRYEYYKLSLLRAGVSASTQSLIDYAMALMDSFFNYSESFPSEPHFIADSDWTGNVFGNYSAVGDATNFTGLVGLITFVENETRNLTYDMAFNYTRDYYNVYNEIFLLNQTVPSSIPTNATLARWGFNLTLYAGSNVTDLLVAFYSNITASWPAGPMYRLYYLAYHTLDICQFKIDTHLLNMMTIGDRVREVCSFLNFVVASEVGAWAYALAEWQATIYEPGGPFV
ncbi:MAG: BPL-N domain-containing protein [Candidatus Hodarchaeota archaeon]